ncbi:MAG: DUF3971 domain-containing protein, partial [Caldimonas sp.]
MSLFPPVVPAALPQRADPASRRSPLRIAARFVVGLVIAAWSLLLIAWLALHWIILPHIQRWRAPIEARASSALGVTVKIGQIEVRSGGWVPGIELRDVVLLDAAQRVALRLPRVVAALSARSLVALDLRFEQLLIDGPELEVRRDAQGRIFIAGLDFGGSGGADDGRAADWFFEQDEFVIRGGAVRWVDEQRGAAPLALTDVQAVVRNGLRRHALRIDATPPPEWGDRFTLQGRFTQRLLGRSGDWKHWSGSAYASLPRADVRELKTHLTLPFALDNGDGALRAWIDVKDGEPRGATVDLALRKVRVRLAPDVDALEFDQVEGRFDGRRDADGVRLALQRFSFRTGDGIQWPQGDLALSLRQRDGAAATGGEFSAQRLDVGVIAQIATRVPLGEALRRLLADVGPRGIARDIAARWDGPLDAPEHYQVKGQLNGLALEPRAAPEPNDPGRPGLNNATLALQASETGGSARLGIDAGAVELPGVLAEPRVPFDRLSASLTWKIEPARAAAEPPRVSVQVKDAKFANADAQGEFAATWSSGDAADSAHGGRYPGRLELDGKLAGAVATRISRYLPLGLPESTRHYLEGAVRGGSVKTATFRVKGHLRDFPFHGARKGGEFRIAAQVDDATFAFAPDEPQWPALTNVGGELVIDRSTLEIRDAKARLGGVEWTRVQGGIANLGERPVVTLDAGARGPLAEMVKVVNATPIGGWIGKALATTSATGAADLQLALAIPLTAIATTTVKGRLVLPGNDLRLSVDTPLLGAAKGRVDFTQKGFVVVGATARVLGGDASFEGGTQADDSIRFSGQGTATADALRRATELGPVARIATALSGQATYRLNLGFVHGRPQVLVTSNLVGIAADLPAPLAKAAAVPLEMRYQTLALDDAQGSPQTSREMLKVDLGTVLQAQYLREHAGESSRVLRGGIGVFGPAPLPASGVAANLNLQRLDVDAWEAAFDKLFGAAGSAAAGPLPPTASASAPPAGAFAVAAAGGTRGGNDYVPDSIALRAQELQSGSRRITSVVVGASEEAGLWRANVTADQLDGYVEFRPSRRRAGPV